MSASLRTGLTKGRWGSPSGCCSTSSASRTSRLRRFWMAAPPSPTLCLLHAICRRGRRESSTAGRRAAPPLPRSLLSRLWVVTGLIALEATGAEGTMKAARATLAAARKGAETAAVALVVSLVVAAQGTASDATIASSDVSTETTRMRTTQGAVVPASGVATRVGPVLDITARGPTAARSATDRRDAIRPAAVTEDGATPPQPLHHMRHACRR